MSAHVFDMIKRLKENENLRKLNYFKRTDSHKANTRPNDDDFKAATIEDSEKIIKEARDE